jgi:hypothetical protein
MKRLTAASPHASNETSTQVAVTTQTLASINPAAAFQLPPYSMTVLTWTASASQIGVTVTPNAEVVAPGGTQQFTAKVLNSSNQSVTWSISPSVGSISSTGIYTAPASISAPLKVSITATAAANTGSRSVVTITVVQPVRLNAGGPAVSGSGLSWAADAYFSGGYSYTTAQAITGATVPALYQTQRSGPFSYSIPLANGTYQVKLRFAELFFSSAGKRVFNVMANGAALETKLDVWAAAGGAFRALDRSHTVSVKTGYLNLTFPTVTDYPILNALDIVPGTSSGSGGTTPPPPTVTITIAPTTAQLSAGQQAQFTATVTGTTNTAVTWSLVPAVGSITSSGLYTAPSTISADQTVAVQARSVANSTVVASAQISLKALTVLHLNAGGSQQTVNGTLWSADSYYSGGWTYAVSSGTVPFTSQRTGTFSYTIPAVNGKYTLRLDFAELWWTAAAKRTFNIDVNGSRVKSSLDVFATAGGANKPLSLNFPITISGGKVVIQFTGVIDNAIVNGIELIP